MTALPISTNYAKKLELQQKQFKHLTNRIRGAFSFKKIKVFQDYLIEMGYTIDYCRAAYNTQELQDNITISKLNELLQDYDISQRVRLWLRYNPPTPDTDLYETFGKVFIPFEVTDSSIIKLESQDKQSNEDDDYGLPPRENSKVNLYWHQKKATAEALTKVCIQKKRCLLVVAATGTGKTFIAGEFIRRVIDNSFIKQSFSPWPIVYVTKASIVEQTKRVLKNLFEIDTIKQCSVINIDQLRSSFGELYIEEKIIVQDGISHVQYHWRPIIHPLIFILDECQVVKNPDSTQSKLIQALAEITVPIYIIFMSASPFTKVSETKAFVLNCHLLIEE